MNPTSTSSDSSRSPHHPRSGRSRQAAKHSKLCKRLSLPAADGAISVARPTSGDCRLCAGCRGIGMRREAGLSARASFCYRINEFRSTAPAHERPVSALCRPLGHRSLIETRSTRSSVGETPGPPRRIVGASVGPHIGPGAVRDPVRPPGMPIGDPVFNRGIPGVDAR